MHTFLQSHIDNQTEAVTRLQTVYVAAEQALGQTQVHTEAENIGKDIKDKKAEVETAYNKLCQEILADMAKVS